MTRTDNVAALAVLTCSAFALLNSVVKADDSSTVPFMINGNDGVVLEATILSEFDAPWAMTFLDDGRALVSEKSGTLWLLDIDGRKLGKVSGGPSVTPSGQGGLGDVIAHPDFARNGAVYLSYVEQDATDGALSGAAVERAVLSLDASGASLTEREVIWRQTPKVLGNGHYGHRLAVSPDNHLFITSGERQKFSPAQNMSTNLGKIIRLNDDGSIPGDNPFVGDGGVAAQVWTLGHRNPLGIDFDAGGQLWVHEMGPKGGDELNRIVRSENYGYPLVSEGEHYDGTPIPSHASNPAYENPAIAWSPVISPAGFVIYDGDVFDDWRGNGFIGGLSSMALIRVLFEETPLDDQGANSKDETETTAREVARYAWGKRVREVEQGPDGMLYVLEDGDNGRLLRLQPADRS